MYDETWILTFLDGSTEERSGSMRIHENVLWIEVRNPNYAIIHEQHAYPLTSLRKWQVKR